ncbi:hypothetical protein ACQ4PT_029243 [Festuca glaucescens]
MGAGLASTTTDNVVSSILKKPRQHNNQSSDQPLKPPAIPTAKASKTRENPPISILKHNQSSEVAKKKPLNGDSTDPLMVSAMPQCKRVSAMPRGQGSENDDSDEADEDPVVPSENGTVVRGPNMGKGLTKLTRSRGSKLPLIITRGRTRPTSALIGAKFVTECNIAVRNHIPVYMHWKKYRQDPRLLCDFYGKMAGDSYMGKEPSPVDLFRETHRSKDDCYSSEVQRVLAEIEEEISQPTPDGERKNETQVLSDVLGKRVKKPMFLQNVGLEHRPTRSNMSTLADFLETERKGKADLQDLVDSQSANLLELNRKVHESRERQAALEAKLETFTRSVRE